MRFDKNKLQQTDYIYCYDCEEYVDFFKYDHDIKSTSHEHCKWRNVTVEELEQCKKDCEQNGCFEEEFI